MANSNKAGTGKRVRRNQLSGNAAQGRGRALKSRPGSKKGMAMAEDAEQEEQQPQRLRKDARADAKPKRNIRRTSAPARAKTDGKPERPPRKVPDKPGNAREGEPTETRGGAKEVARPSTTSRSRRRAQPDRAESTAEAKRRKRTGGGFAGVKRAAPTSAASRRS